MERRHFATGTVWEPQVGYSRAIRVGPFIHVSGTTATNEKGEVVALGDPYGQTIQILRNIETALRALGASIQHIVRTRMYVVDIDRWQEIGKAHGEFFAKVRPATSMVEVHRLIAPEILVEIEADAIVPEDTSHRE